MKRDYEQIKPMGSHLIKFDKPRIAIIEGYLEEVYGIVVNDYYSIDGNGYDSFETSRTILVGEGLAPAWHIKSYNESIRMYFIKNYPVLSKEDFFKCIIANNGARGWGETFDDLEEYGFSFRTSDEVIHAKIDYIDNHYSISSEYFPYIEERDQWIPLVLDKLYSIQRFTHCRIELSSNTLSETSLKLMNQLLENQLKNRIFINEKEGTGLCVNDGVYAYYKNGFNEAMTREEFMAKYPAAYEYEN